MDDDIFLGRAQKLYDFCKKSLLLFFLLVFFLAMMTSCRSVQYVPYAVQTHSAASRVDSLRQSAVCADTVLRSDTVCITLSAEGDTVSRTEVRWRDRISVRRDTVETLRRDSVYIEVPVEVPVEVEVEKSKSLADKILEWVFVLVGINLAVVVVTALIRAKWKD